MLRLIRWNPKVLSIPSVPLRGPLLCSYVEELRSLCQSLNGVYLAGIQVGDARRFAVPSLEFDKFEFPVLYNPEVLDAYDPVSEDEGCLSFPGLWVKIRRFRYLEFQFRDQNWDSRRVVVGGEENDGFSYPGSSLLAKAIQHEIAHMDGKLFYEGRTSNPKLALRAKVAITKQNIALSQQRDRPGLIVGPSEICCEPVG